MAPAHEEKARVRGQAKRLFSEAMKIEIHHTLPSGRQVLHQPRPMDGMLLPSTPTIKRGKTKKERDLLPVYIIFQ
jgi:hypothetical protein